MYKVSVIIPVYNAEPYLRACLDSAVNQTLKEIEIICIDDGSTDSSAAIAAEYMARYDNIRLIRQENGGPSKARNAGLDMATGDYICFLDSDDTLELQAVEKLYRAAACEALDILYFNTRPIFHSEKVQEKNAQMEPYYDRGGEYAGLCTGQTMFTRMRRDNKYLPSVCLQLLRRGFLEEQGLRFYPGILHEDNLFSFQCVMTARRVNYIPDRLHLRRVREDSIMTSTKTIRHLEGYLVSYYESLIFLQDIPLQEDAVEAVNFFLYQALYRNACNVWNGLSEEERSKPLVHGGIGTQQLLYMCRRAAELEQQKNNLRQRNEKLAAQLKSGKKPALKERIKGLLRPIARLGIVKAARKAVWNGRAAVRNFRKRHTPAIIKGYRVLAAEKGSRIARQELLVQIKAELRRPWREMAVKRQMKKGGEVPLVSFILPVYNVEPYLQQALDCLLEQTLKHIEIICVDDGSTDNSLEILRRYEQKDSRVRVFTQKNQYAGVARNHGLSKATGEYVCFLDPDDFFEKNLAKQTYIAAKVDAADVVLFNADRYDNVSGEISSAGKQLHRQFVPWKRVFNRRDCPDTLYQITTPCPWTKLFRRQFLLDAGLQFQALRNTNDVFFVHSALAMAERITTVDKNLVHYRVGLTTNLQATKARAPLCFYEAYTALHDNLKEQGLLEQVRRSYVNVALSGCMHDWMTQKDPDARKMVGQLLHSRGFRELEIAGHEADYYYNPSYYETMQQILSGAVLQEEAAAPGEKEKDCD